MKYIEKYIPPSKTPITFFKWKNGKIIKSWLKKRQTMRNPVRGTKRYKHQEAALQFAYSKKQAALFMEQGTGKTKVAIDWVLNKYQTISNVLVVCPKKVIENWEDQVKDFGGKCTVVSLIGNPEERENLIKTFWAPEITYFPTFFVINYDGTKILEETLLEYKWDAIILDESTAIGNYATQRSHTLIRLSKIVERKMIMTGTPITKHYFDIFNQFLFLDGGKTFGTSFYTFRWKFFRPAYQTKEGQVFEWVPRDIKAFRRLIKENCFVARKKDCLDLPPKVYQKVYVDMTETQKKHFKNMRKDFETQLKDGERVSTKFIVAKLAKMRQISSGFLKRTEAKGVEKKVWILSREKIKAIEELTKELTVTTKIIIWCSFKFEKKLVCRMLDKNKIRYTTIERPFKKDPNVKVFVGSTKSDSEGLNLTKASYALFFSNSHSLKDRIQAEDRCHRIGSEIHKSITYIDFITRKSTDEMILQNLKTKKDIVKELIHHPEMLAKF